MSKRTWIFTGLALPVLLFAPGGAVAGTLQLALVSAAAISAIKDAAAE